MGPRAGRPLGRALPKAASPWEVVSSSNRFLPGARRCQASQGAVEGPKRRGTRGATEQRGSGLSRQLGPGHCGSGGGGSKGRRDPGRREPREGGARLSHGAWSGWAEGPEGELGLENEAFGGGVWVLMSPGQAKRARGKQGAVVKLAASMRWEGRGAGGRDGSFGGKRPGSCGEGRGEGLAEGERTQGRWRPLQGGGGGSGEGVRGGRGTEHSRQGGRGTQRRCQVLFPLVRGTPTCGERGAVRAGGKTACTDSRGCAGLAGSQGGRELAQGRVQV